MKRILLDAEKCLGCHTCENACAGVHSKAGSFIGAVLAGEKPRSGVKVMVNAAGKIFAKRCRQCRTPECVEVCPVSAMKKDMPDGAVWCSVSECIGCFKCAGACPIGAISRLEDKRRPFKCDLCHSAGGDPACVKACPTGALTFEEIDAARYEVEKKALENNLKGVI